MTVQKPPIAINLNFDSFSEAFGFPDGFVDSSFFVAFDRFERIILDHGMKLSIYIIGRDLENKKIFDRVRDWSKNGHEIGNHSYSHHMSLGGIDRESMTQEVTRSHDLITKAAEVEPRGFIAPNWASSKELWHVLLKLGYEYDSSCFPSIFLYPMIGKIWCNHIGLREKQKRVLNRRDWISPLNMPKAPFFFNQNGEISTSRDKNCLLILPLPCASRLLPCYWHTLGFVFGWGVSKLYLKYLLSGSGMFYYLLHPADFVDLKDFSIIKNHGLERMNISLEEKLAAIANALSIIKDSCREVVHMRDLARFYL